MLNSRLSLFSAAWSPRHSFSRSYGVILPSSLTTLLPFVLGCSPCLPVSVCGTGGGGSASSFSGQREIRDFPTSLSFPFTAQPFREGGFAFPPGLTAWPGSSDRRVLLSFCVTASLSCRLQCRNLNLLSIAYAFRPRLRPRLTLSGQALLRKPWAFDGGVSHPSFRYSCQHSLF